MLAFIPVVLLCLASMILAPKLRMRSSVVYLILLMAGLDLLCLSAQLHVLRPAAWIFYGLLGLLILCFFARHRGRAFSLLRQQSDLYLLLNGGCSLLFSVIFTLQQPHFYYWDEFSFWGPAAKYMKYTHQLHTVDPNPYMSFAGYPGGNSVLNYFFSFFSPTFQEHLMLLAYALLYFAVFSTAAALLYEKTKNHALAISGYLVLFLTPFMSTTHAAAADYTSLSYAYGTIMPDFNLAVVLLAGFALYLYRPRRGWFLLPLLYLCYVKRAGFLFLLLALCLIGCLWFFSCRRIPLLCKRICMAALLLVLLPLAWCGLMGPRATAPADAAVAAAETDTAPSWAESFRQEHPSSKLAVLIPQLGSDRFQEILAEVTTYFRTNHETVFGPDYLLIAGLLGLGLLTVLGGDQPHRLSLLGVALGLTAGCFLYSRVIAHQAQLFANQMVEYPRYMQSYYFSWMFAVLLLFLLAPYIQAHFKQLLLCGVMLLTLFHIQQVGLDYTVFAAPQNAYAGSYIRAEKLAPVREIVQPDETVYLIYPHLETEIFLHYQYDFLPIFAGFSTADPYTNFSMGYRTPDYPEDPTYYSLTPAAYTETMQAAFDYIYVVQPDPDMQDSYAQLFSDGMTAGQLYRVTDQDVPMQALLP